ncbi:ATP-grasp peptide maturase system methyltransferase [Saccharomonospora sp. NPDC006951]
MGFAARERKRLVARLRRDGVLTDPLWAEAFRRVPRHAFLPRFFLPDGQRWVAVEEGDEGWLDACYSDIVLVTQLDDDPGRWLTAREEGPVTGVPTCSSSMPGIMAVMLEELRVREGDKVLEIGTGTGYNTALLCERVGDANVSTVDIDPVLLPSAKSALNTLGYRPRCELADGANGFPEAAPYDRLLCTCAVSGIPKDWLAQTREGGLVLTTLNRPIGSGLVRVVAGSGDTGEGRVLARNGRFMPMRSHRRPDVSAVIASRDVASTTVTELSLADTLDPAHPFEFFLSLELPGTVPIPDPSGGDTCYLAHPDGSWASHRTVAGEYLVEQGGPRRLWDTVEAAHRRWYALGKPARDRFAVSITGDRQEFRLGSLRWPLA